MRIERKEVVELLQQVPLFSHLGENEVNILSTLFQFQVFHDGEVVFAAGDPSEVMYLIYDGRIHLLMTDVVMPNMNGLELAHNLRPLCPNLKHLFMSGYSANVIAHHGVLDEGVNFIHKPFSKEDLFVKVREALNGADGDPFGLNEPETRKN